MNGFTYRNPVKVIFGAGSVARIGDEAANLGTCALIVSYGDLWNIEGKISDAKATDLVDDYYETNELQSRYLLVGLKAEEKTLFDQGSREGKSEKSGQKKAVRKSGQKKRSEKSGQKTVDRLWQLLKEHPHLSQAGLVAALGITRSTIQKHVANLKAAGRLRRVGPDKGGHWEVVESPSKAAATRRAKE